MKALMDVQPTPEQLTIFSRLRPGVEVIRGSAGSGKTTTAILKLTANIGFFQNRKRRLSATEDIKVLVLTFNRTLRGYVEELAMSRIARAEGVQVEVNTFAKWALNALGNPSIVDNNESDSNVMSLGHHLGLGDYLKNEVEYVSSRFLPESLGDYLTARRDGRGASPRVERALREKLLSEVITPHEAWKKQKALFDWNDLAVSLTKRKLFSYDIVVVDEAQDFSANQIRAIMNQLNEDHTVTFVLDTAQRIYARGYTWSEVGIALRPENSHRLQHNYRNTKQIAAFALPLLAGLEADDDYTLPDFSKCTKDGDKPIILSGCYSEQVKYAINYIKNKVDLTKDSVAFLHPRGGRWFDYLRDALTREQLSFAEITRQSDWPRGNENIALSTLHSSKGLEFDYVFILGVNIEVMPDGEIDIGDDRNTAARKLLAVGIGRARQALILGYKDDEMSSLLRLFDASTYVRERR